MILAALGSQKFQFNRLLEELDSLAVNDDISGRLYAQVGWSDYIPKNYKYKKFFERKEYESLINKAEIVITHGGVGTIMSAVKIGKPTIVYPRLKKYNEHVDDHQLETAQKFAAVNYALCCYENENLYDIIHKCRNHKFDKYSASDTNIIDEIEAFIYKNF